MSRNTRRSRRPVDLAAALIVDLRYALRAVRKDLRLFVFAAVIIGLGIGACTAVFSVLSPLLLRELPLEDPDRLVWVANAGEGGMSSVTSRSSNLRDFREANQSFDGLTGYFAFFEQGSYNLVGDGEPARLVGVDVAHDFLDVLGVRPALGRSFTEEEGQWGGPDTVILSHGLWLRQFGGDPDVVGTSVVLNDTPNEIVGVLPRSFDFAATFTPHTRVDFLRTFPISDETDRWGNTLTIIGRLAEGSSIESAQADLDRIIVGLEEADPERWGLGAVVTGMQAKIAGPYRTALLLLAAAAGMVMLIVCVNLSNLLLAKGTRRSSEMAVRSALGAPRARLIRQMLIESLLLSAAGVGLGLGMAMAATRFVTGASGLNIPLLNDVSVDGAALAFSGVLALVVGILVGIVPALQVASGGEAAAFNSTRRGMSANRRSTRLREGLVIAEVALACVLLVAGGLLLRSFQNVLDVDLGFEPAQVAVWQLNSNRSFETLAEEAAYYDQLVANVQAIPGVESVGLTDAVPLGRNRSWDLKAPGREYDGVSSLTAFPHIVDSRYLQAMGIPLLAGRYFDGRDNEQRGNVIILNETAAREVYQGEDVLGRTVLIGRTECEVVGIVADIRHRALELGAGPQMYLPITQIGDFGALDMVVRSALPADALAGSVASAIQAVDPTLPTREYRTLDSVVDLSLSPRRFTLQLLIAFAASALLLAALGIYGVLSYAVGERIPEIGIRMALGDTAGGILRRVVGRTLALAAIGLVIGAIGSIVASRWITSLLYSVHPGDPGTFGIMSVLLLSVAGLAGLVPALRASRTEPASVLRANG